MSTLTAAEIAERYPEITVARIGHWKRRGYITPVDGTVPARYDVAAVVRCESEAHAGARRVIPVGPRHAQRRRLLDNERSSTLSLSARSTPDKR